MFIGAQTINLTHTHSKTHARTNIVCLHTHCMEVSVSFVWCSLHLNSCVGGQAAMLTADGLLFHKTVPPASHSLMISITNML